MDKLNHTKNIDYVGFGLTFSNLRRESFFAIALALKRIRLKPFLWKQAAEEVLLAIVERKLAFISIDVWDGWGNSDATPDTEAEAATDFGDGKFTIALDTYNTEEDRCDVIDALIQPLRGVVHAYYDRDGGSFAFHFQATELDAFPAHCHEADKIARRNHWTRAARKGGTAV